MATVINGIRKKLAAPIFKIQRSIFFNRCFGRHTRSVGCPIILTLEKEHLISKTLDGVAQWGFPITKHDVSMVIKNYLNRKKRINIFILTNNTACDHIMNAYTQRKKENCNIMFFCNKSYFLIVKIPLRYPNSLLFYFTSISVVLYHKTSIASV